jgi:UDP-N-acetylmuramyl tripeptide synthase
MGAARWLPSAANFFAHPEARLKLSGVTGTNGKTTTAFLLEAMLRHQGRETVLAGTIEYHAAGQNHARAAYHARVARPAWSCFVKASTAARPRR